MAVWEITLSTNDISEISDIDNLKNDTPTDFPNYALCLPRYSKLNGQYSNVREIDVGNVGYMSESISDENGDFAVPPSITMSFARRKTSDGFQLIFNRLSGDYCNDLHIQWYKYGELMAEADYYPDSPEFFCEAELGMFDTAVLTFRSTNKPHRHLWLALLDNALLTGAEGLKIYYNDTAYGAKDNMTITTEDESEISDHVPLFYDDGFPTYPKWAYCYPRYAKLDGNFINVPSSAVSGMSLSESGFVSSGISDENGDFADDPSITFTFSQVIESIGIHLCFDNRSGDYCDEVTIQWYLNDVLLDEEMFQPTAAEYFCYHAVDHYDKVTVTFHHTSKPYRPAILQNIAFGLYKIFDETEITTGGVYEQISLTGDSQPIGTLDFSARVEDVVFRFEKAQKLFVYFDRQIIGQFFLKSGERTSEYHYKIKAENVISLLDSETHVGGFYTAANAAALIREMFTGQDVNVVIDESIENETVTGWLPYDTCRKNLAQVCFAIGAIVDTSFETDVYVYKFDPTLVPTPIGDKFIYSDTLKVTHSDVVTGVRLTVHSWAPKTAGDKDELFKAALNGQTLVKFDAPRHSLTITGGTIVSSGDNYAVISGTGSEVILSGYGYNHNTEIVEMDNEYVYRNKKVVESKDATLVTSANASAVLNSMFDYYTNNESLKADAILNDVQLSDIVQLNSFEGTKTAVINALSMKFYGEIKAGVEMKCI